MIRAALNRYKVLNCRLHMGIAHVLDLWARWHLKMAGRIVDEELRHLRREC